MYPTSQGSGFLDNYYSDTALADYLLFTADKKFENGDLMGSNLRASLDVLVFNNVSNKSFEVTSMSTADRRVDALNEYILQFADEFDMRRVALLPNETVRLGTIVVKDKAGDEQNEYLFILNDFKFDLL